MYCVRLIKVNSETRKLAEYAAPIAANIIGCESPPIEFFEEVEPSRSLDIIWLDQPAFGFYRDARIYLRNDLQAGQMVKSCFHETLHFHQGQKFMRTLKIPFNADVSNERDAFLFAEQHAGDLKRTASAREA